MRLRGDAGQIGGIEAVPFGLLVLLVGILVVAHTWAVVDGKFVTTTAAREATRAYVEAPDEAQGLADARRAAGRPVTHASADDFGRCAPARFEVVTSVPAFGLPWLGDRPTVTVRSAHEELVDPYRDGLPGVADCP